MLAHQNTSLPQLSQLYDHLHLVLQCCSQFVILTHCFLLVTLALCSVFPLLLHSFGLSFFLNFQLSCSISLLAFSDVFNLLYFCSGITDASLTSQQLPPQTGNGYFHKSENPLWVFQLAKTSTTNEGFCKVEVLETSTYKGFICMLYFRTEGKSVILYHITYNVKISHYSPIILYTPVVINFTSTYVINL